MVVGLQVRVAGGRSVSVRAEVVLLGEMKCPQRTTGWCVIELDPFGPEHTEQSVTWKYSVGSQALGVKESPPLQRTRMDENGRSYILHTAATLLYPPPIVVKTRVSHSASQDPGKH